MFTIKYANQEIKGKLRQFTPAEQSVFLFEGNMEVHIPVRSPELIATMRSINLEKMQFAILDVGLGKIELIQESKSGSKKVSPQKPVQQKVKAE
jgi:hypothetical protein